MGNQTKGSAVLTAYAKSLIRFKARQLTRNAGYARSDREDLEQELVLQLLSKAHLYDASRASADTFADRVITSAIAMILRDRRRQKRAAGLTAKSLERTRAGQEHGSVALRDVIVGEDLRRRGALGDDATGRDAFCDVNDVLASLPAEVQGVCRRLADGNAASMAREMGISRRQLRNVVGMIRRRFEAAGLGNS
jgi:RNA polymerase sigma-70 factor, ECF subfamily